MLQFGIPLQFGVRPRFVRVHAAAYLADLAAGMTWHLSCSALSRCLQAAQSCMTLSLCCCMTLSILAAVLGCVQVCKHLTVVGHCPGGGAQQACHQLVHLDNSK